MSLLNDKAVPFSVFKIVLYTFLTADGSYISAVIQKAPFIHPFSTTATMNTSTFENVKTLKPFLEELKNIEDNEGLLFQVIQCVLKTVHVEFAMQGKQVYLCSLKDEDSFALDKRGFAVNLLTSE